MVRRGDAPHTSKVYNRDKGAPNVAKQRRISSDSIQSHLLAALPHAESQRWLPLLESVDSPLGEVLYELGITLSHVYFPTTAIISLLYVMENGASAEIAVVGNEGIVGISLFMGGESHLQPCGSAKRG
jgi:hypothetical protein